MAAHQAPLSLGFSRQEHWSGLPFPSPMHESEKWKWSRSVVSNPPRPHGLQPSRLLHPWDFPGKSTGVGCHCLLRTKPYLQFNLKYSFFNWEGKHRHCVFKCQSKFKGTFTWPPNFQRIYAQLFQEERDYFKCIWWFNLFYARMHRIWSISSSYQPNQCLLWKSCTTHG